MGKILKILTHRAFLVGLSIAVQLFALMLMLLRFNEYFQAFNILCYAFSLIIVVFIVGDKSNPAYKIAWIVPIMLFPIFGWLLYLLFGGNRLSKRLRKKMNGITLRFENELRVSCRAEELRDRLGDDAGCMAAYLERAACCPIYGNTESEYFALGENMFASILRELEKAEKYIFLEYFILEPGQMWDPILEILEKKAAAGVDVRVLYDDVGSLFTLPRNYAKRLREKGIQCIAFNRFIPALSVRMNNRDHRKILSIDGRVAYTGGINLADEYINEKERFGHWKDTGILLRGDGAWSLTVMFLSMWESLTDRLEDYAKYRPEPTIHESKGYVQPYCDSPLDDEPVGETVYLNLINRAKRYVYIVTPYLIIDHATTLALASAAKAGVDVRIITPHIPDKKMIFEVTRAHYPPLLQAGVKIYEYTPGFIHAKNFVVDDRFATVGTVNMDYRSMFLHFEDGVVLYGTDSVRDIKMDFLATQAVSQSITTETCKSLFAKRRILRALLRLFAPLM